MNQWIERIQFALPTAKIGKLQGDKCEIEGCDIVIAMLQTLSMKDFPMDTFDDIGHVIIDECHRIPSRVFCKALMKINSPYMLGLSATPNRKDGLTKVLKWSIGDIVYSVKSSEKNIVKVDRYILESEDENYNKEVYSFRGQIQISTMVNNIAGYGKRTRLIMEKVSAAIEENEKRQILILSDRKQHLEDMYNLGKEMGIESIGYYVGGMKKEKLKESESCRLLLGTYPMANEGLDIPSLNGLVLSTPKSDIIQSIGRICRQKHEGIQPLIIDMVDTFSIFENQSRKRMKVYEKKKYQVTDIFYNLDKSFLKKKKEYYYHMFTVNSSDEEVSVDKDDDDDGLEKVDTEYNNINPKTNKKIKSAVKPKNEKKNIEDMSQKEIDNLFKNFSFFT